MYAKILDKLVGQHHRHDKHQDVFGAIFLLADGEDDASAAGMRHLDEYLLGIDVGDHLAEELGIEADFHRLALIFAGEFLAGVVRELKVFGTNNQLAGLDRKAYLMGGLVGKEAHATQGVEERIAVDSQLVGILLGNGGFVVGVLAIHQTADDVEVLESEECVGVVELNLDLLLLLLGSQDVAQHGDGLAGQDEAGGIVGVDVASAIADQLVGIGDASRRSRRQRRCE